ncbi:MAG: SLC13 family permease [Anaerolineaceae bacterium]|nr:MAG: SLC13 family permease [Anaerolineaceae bacterium]
MTPEIAIVLGILGIAIVLFITEWVRIDVTALMVLVSLALTGLVSPSEALSGFSNPAVITVWAILILSGGLARTGIAGLIGHRVLRLAGKSEIRLLTIIMLTVGVLSGFMNDIGVASLFLPVVIDIARRIKRAPSKLLMPLAFAALLGGLNTLIGTPPNILISEALGDAGLRSFQMFDYTPVGVAVLIAGTAFMVFVGRRLLPERDIAREFTTAADADYKEMYELHERMIVLRLPPETTLDGKTLAESRLGSILGLNVIGILRGDETHLAPSPDACLRSGDRLLVEGRLDQLSELHDRRHFIIEEERLPAERLISGDIELVEISFLPQSPLIGQNLRQLGFRHQYGVIVLAIKRDSVIIRTNLERTPLQSSDVLLVQAHQTQIRELKSDPDLQISKPDSLEDYHLEERLMMVHVPHDSSLVGKTLIESRLGDAFGLGVMGIVRQGTTHLMPAPEDQLMAGDTLLIKGKREDLITVEGLQSLEIETREALDMEQLESEEIGLVEAVLSPHTTLVGKTPRELNFRAKYGLSVLAIWREGRAYRSNLRDMALRFGDALLLYGPRDKLRILGSEPDFLVLTEEVQEAPRLKKAPVALLVMGLVLLPVILGWVPIAISAIAGVALMILTGCLNMEEAYRFIQWKAIFLIAGMLPLGIAMEQTGAARFLAEGVVNIVGSLGPLAIMAGLFILAALASQVMPNPAVAVLLAPIALNTAADLGVSPYPLMMAVAVSASAAFLSPVGHSANILIMGPGGYRFSDYIKVGLPLTLVVLVVVLLVMPIFWPF